MKWLKRLGLVLVVFVILFVGIGLVLPTTYTVERSVVIDAPRPVIHELVSDLERWPDWEPWTKADPTVTVTLGDQTTGVGANQTWDDSNGGGALTFTSVDPQAGVAYDVSFAQTYECVGRVTYADHPDGVEVTWSMDGDTGTPVIGGYFAKLMPGMIGPMFEDGMQRLKAAAEAAPSDDATDPAEGSHQEASF